jgi:hypothetical protein
MQIAGRTVLLIVFALLFSPPASGQDAAPSWTVGARAGPTSLTIGSDLDGTVDRRVGLSAGAFATVGLPGPFALQPNCSTCRKEPS